MKRILCLILTLALLLSFTACDGNFARVDLNEPISLSEDGIVRKEVLNKIKSDNAIAVFTGTYESFKYEWTIFGSDIVAPRDVNLSISVFESNGGIKVDFSESEELGFSALVSIHLNEKYNANSATAYNGETEIGSVSITGSKTSILNLSVNNKVSECLIIPDTVISSEETSSQTQPTESDTYTPTVKDDYLSSVKDDDNRVYSDGKTNRQDKYNTDPVPAGKPLPVEPENQEINKTKTHTCTFSIECSTILNNLKDLDPDKLELVPSNGIILAPTKVTFYEGESVFDVLKRVCRENGIHMESSWTPIYNSAYIEGIHNLYEFDCGALSGWMYCVDGWYPNYGASRYQLKDGENVQWRYTCDLGKDVGCDWLAGTQ